MSSGREKWNGIGYALLAACLFGASVPFAKLLLPQVSPGLMAGLLYLGSGFGLGVFWLARAVPSTSPRQEASLKARDWPWLAAAILTGGIAAPMLLMWGLSRSQASSASLLLNLEAVFTALLARFVFKENFGVRLVLGMALITAGGVCLSWSGWSRTGVFWSRMAVCGACLGWAIDSNLTRKVSAVDPVQTAMIKGFAAGVVNVGLALASGAGFPGVSQLVQAGTLGLLGYGVSLVLFVLALRHLGTARTSAYFSTAPFVGAAIAILGLRETSSTEFFVAAGLMGAGVWLYLTESHSHPHRHEPTWHEHVHSHDEHHQHAHEPTDPPGEPHCHAHRHLELTHSHPHFPDIHHRHGH